MSQTTIQFLWQDRSIPNRFRAGISLHSHTMYSEENLGMIPRYTNRVPVLGRAIRAQSRKYLEVKGKHLDFSQAFWTPPLAPRQAYRLEQKQIRDVLQLPGFVSLTDHDDIRAGAQLRMLNDFEAAPVSTEWTIPFGPTFFHLGVHNLPAQQASSIMEKLHQFTAAPAERLLGDLLAWLHSRPEVLLVLNHPCWDEKGIGQPQHSSALRLLADRYGQWFHALELNGLRRWEENQKVIRLGQERNIPVISGGDRHGLEPNAILNLSHGSTLVEFIDEIRTGRRSHVVFMPQYREPIRLRVVQTMVDVVREYPDSLEGRRSWADRVYVRPGGNPAVSLRHYWPNGGPLVIRAFIKAMRAAEFRGIRSAMRLAFYDRCMWSDQEAAV